MPEELLSNQEFQGLQKDHALKCSKFLFSRPDSNNENDFHNVNTKRIRSQSLKRIIGSETPKTDTDDTPVLIRQAMLVNDQKCLEDKAMSPNNSISVDKPIVKINKLTKQGNKRNAQSKLSSRATLQSAIKQHQPRKLDKNEKAKLSVSVEFRAKTPIEFPFDIQDLQLESHQTNNSRNNCRPEQIPRGGSRRKTDFQTTEALRNNAMCSSIEVVAQRKKFSVKSLQAQDILNEDLKNF